MTDLGSRGKTGSIDNTGFNPYGLGLYSVEFTPKDFAVGANIFEVYHIAVKGPAGSTLEVWINQTFYSATPRGDINDWDPNIPLVLRGGQSLIFYWNSNAAPVPLVTVWMRTPAISL